MPARLFPMLAALLVVPAGCLRAPADEAAACRPATGAEAAAAASREAEVSWVEFGVGARWFEARCLLFEDEASIRAFHEAHGEPWRYGSDFDATRVVALRTPPDLGCRSMQEPRVSRLDGVTVLTVRAAPFSGEGACGGESAYLLFLPQDGTRAAYRDDLR